MPNDCPIGLTRYFYDTLIPKDDPWKLIELRKWLLEKAWSDPAFAEELWIMCSRDLLFYLAAFVWILEPRDKAPWNPSRCFGNAKEIPFIPRPYQEDALVKMQAALGSEDMLANKSREMGATWMVLLLFDWAWRFHPQNHFGVVSKDEDSADNPDDPDSLLSKMDFLDEHLPSFLRPTRDRNRTAHTILNRDNGSSITGYACTGNMVRGGRKRAMFCDEVHSWPPISDYAAFDSLQHVTYCRIMVSTPNRERGQAGAFYDACQNSEAKMRRFEWSWMLDHSKAAGLYRANGNEVEILDKDYRYPPGFKFVRDGQTRSPYYDYECSRPGATEQSIAAELGMNFGGATSRFFQPSAIYKARSCTREPNARVEVRKVNNEYIPELIHTEREPAIELWVTSESHISMTDNGVLKIPDGRMYSMGVDIAGGKGGAYSSCSAAAIIDRRTKAQVAEYAYNKIEPEDFAVMCYYLGKVFNTALMCIEVTGVGHRFLSKIMSMEYGNLWQRPASRDDIRQGASYRVGYDNKDGGQLLLGELQQAFHKDQFQPRSKAAIQECERYYFDSKGNLKHPLVGQGRSDAPEKSHGDRAIAMAAAWFAIHSEGAMIPQEEAQEAVPYGSPLWRRQQARGLDKEKCRWWAPLEELRT